MRHAVRIPKLKILGLFAPLLLFGLLLPRPVRAGGEMPDAKDILSPVTDLFPKYKHMGPGRQRLLNQDASSLEGLSKPFTFDVLGDTRTGYHIYGKLVSMMAKDAPAFVMNTGDTVFDPGDPVEWDRFVELSKPLKMPYMIAPGNHDISGKKTEEIFREDVNQPGKEVYYSFTAADLLFVALDSEQVKDVSKVNGEQLKWLEGVLKASKERFKFVFLHRPLYPSKDVGEHYGDSMNEYTEDRDRLEKLLKEYGVDAVFAGHEHLYSRKEVDGIVHVITGGGGAPLYARDKDGGFYHYIRATADGDSVSFEVVGIDGKIKDTFTITKDGAR